MSHRRFASSIAGRFAQQIAGGVSRHPPQSSPSPVLALGGARGLSSLMGGGGAWHNNARYARDAAARPRAPTFLFLPRRDATLARTRAGTDTRVRFLPPNCFNVMWFSLSNRCGGWSSSPAGAAPVGWGRGVSGPPVMGDGLAVGGVRGMAKGKYVKVPNSGGVEGFDDAFLKSIKKRLNPLDPFKGE